MSYGRRAFCTRAAPAAPRGDPRVLRRDPRSATSPPQPTRVARHNAEGSSYLLTMTDQGPQIGNIALKGLFDRKGLDPSMFRAYDRKGHPAEAPKAKKD